MLGKKYSINDFYVGELDIDGENKKAVRISSLEIDLNKKYDSYLTLFIKKGANYVCLHNGKVYRIESSYLKKIEPVTKYLFVYDIDKFQMISIKEALFIFNRLFNSRKKPIFSHVKDKFVLEDFYVGTLNIFSQTGFNDNNCQLANVAERLTLVNRDCYIGCHGYEETYDQYRCLFLNQKFGFLNLDNNVVYKEGNCLNEYYQTPYYGSIYYEYMHKLSDYLTSEEQEKYKSLTLDTAQKIYKRNK